ncbi:MAG: Stk1 family PASTA domain-containing Ser/Thr kinase, partial [Oscillospiraceae bacterium]|nr:Stk1 family PASTA domain-containing Ser/Thr kinase [Oscillospiraceae bacterium]
MDTLIGKKIDGRYQIEALVGVGGMANVYRANDLAAQRPVAVKILREEFLQNEELVRRFKNESRAISLLDHPNIVKVYDVSVSDRLQYIVMELVDGINLKEYMVQRKEKLSWKEAVHFVTQILEALQHAHEKGIVHRDIKPQNIMLLQSGQIKVMDFGIARFSRAGLQTMTDKAMGSVHYISPEQAKGDVTDCRADIYSVGVMLYEMLTGQLPFDADTPVSVAIKQISDKPRSPRELKPEIPPALESIVLRAMEKDPQRRYQNAEEMLRDIARFKQDPSISFEYKYIQDDAPTRYIDQVVGKANKAGQAGRPTGAKAPAKKKNQKKSRYLLPILAGMAVAFALGALILIYMIFKFSGNPLFNDTETVPLPDFSGMTRSEIEQKKTDGEYKFTFIYEEVYQDSDTYPVGTIYDQNPKPPKTVKEDAKIKLKISKGVQEVVVPDVTNYSKADAEKALSAVGLKVMTYQKADTSVALGNVIYTEPAANTTVKYGDRITVYIAAEAVANREVEVPDLTNLLVNSPEMLQKLNEKQLTRGNISSVPNSAPVGTIIQQEPLPGEKVKVGTRVNLMISSGETIKTFNLTIYLDKNVKEGETYTLSEGSSITRSANPAGDTLVVALRGRASDSLQTFTLTGPDNYQRDYVVDWGVVADGAGDTITIQGPPPVSSSIAPPVSSS